MLDSTIDSSETRSGCEMRVWWLGCAEVLGKRFVKEGTKDRLGLRDSRWEELGSRRLRKGCGLDEASDCPYARVVGPHGGH